MIQGLLRIQFRNRRKYPKGIRRQKEDILRVSPEAGKDGVVYEVEWVCSARVFGDRTIVIVGDFALPVEHHVLKDRTPPDSIPNLRLVLLGEVNAFRVTTAFEVENPGVAPTMFIVAYQVALRICGQSGFPSARKAEKRAVSPFAPRFAEQCIGRTSRRGRRKFRTVKIDFLISPA